MNTSSIRSIPLLVALTCAANAATVKPDDWAVWGQNAANTRSNAAELSVPPPTLQVLWSVGPVDTGIYGVRYGIIADGQVYGSYVEGNNTVVERRDLLTSAQGSGFPLTINNRWSYFPPAMAQGILAFGLGGFGKNPCTGGNIYSIDPSNAKTITNQSLLPPPLLYQGRIAYAGTAVESTGFFYFSGICPPHDDRLDLKSGSVIRRTV